MGNYYETFYPPFFMETRYAYDAIAVNPDGYDRDDFDIIRDVYARLKGLAPLDSSHVMAESHDQIIHLTGSVASDAAVRFLGRVADNVLGVRSVDNRLMVSRPGASFDGSDDLNDATLDSSKTKISPSSDRNSQIEISK